MNARSRSASQMQGRYEVAPYWRRWGVYDLLEMRGDPLSIHDDEIDAIADAAKRNAREKR